uniref:uncharacterized protein LOC122583078 n=1 Tax=Erigeron canadensis TaxID=72917 RepID=UPI001CB8A451|nr:uncharacterized protein LOC122583078 [Erigeron canadensis]
MPIFARTKQATGALDDRVRNQIVGRDISQTDPAYFSSGSEHSSAHDIISPSSHCISDLSHCFLQQLCAGEKDEKADIYDSNSIGSESESECDESNSDSDSENTDIINDGLMSVFRNLDTDRHRNQLLFHVTKAIEISRSIKLNNSQNRNVMLCLQKIGYNAAVCKTSWKSCGGLTAGNHEFIDVVRTDTGDRYFIDINFASEFEIARETKHFRRVSRHLPTVFVGKQEHLKQVVKLVSDAARKSLKARGLLVPPWRKNRFMQNKWFGPYRRTVNYTPTNNIVNKSPMSSVNCSLYGFNAVSGSNGGLLTTATRTR